MSADFDVVTSPLRVAGADAVPHPLLVEAGAGSGKTWTLAHLAVRFMIEDAVEPDEILLVTFTRDAARELRGRVREHLSDVIGLLEHGVNDDAPWRRHLGQRWSDPTTAAADLARARHCRASLDGLQARTIHSFAAVNVVGTPGALSDDKRLWRQATNECLARWSLERDDELLGRVDLATLDAVAEALYQSGVRRGGRATSVRVVPEGAASDAPAGDERLARLQRDLALEIVDRFCDLLRRSGRSSYADLLVALADRLEGYDARRFRDDLRATFRVVMIDEFQDTDPLQWHVFRELFFDAPATRLVLVGDPKQAIYGFRSGGVETFLEVREDCRRRGVPVATLRFNYRSTPQLVEAVNAMFAGTDFHYSLEAPGAEPSINFLPAVAVRDDVGSELLCVDGTDASLHLRAAPYKANRDHEVLEGVAAYVTRARQCGYAYRDVAVLCTSNFNCNKVHNYLSRRRIPSVTASGDSIFTCDAARQLRLLLVALESPQDVGLTEALRATWFRGEHAADPTSSEVGGWVTQLAEEFARVGVAALTRFTRTRAVQSVVLATRDGERHLTDLHHLGELASRECDGVRSVALVIDWLDAASAALDVDEGATARRLETESDAVRVLTVHKAKGLEFPVVLLAFVSDQYRVVGAKRQALQRWVDDGVTVVDAGSGFAWGDAHAQQRRLRTEAASAGEHRRLLYVAVTRARDAAVLWAPMARQTQFSGELARILYDREDGPSGTSVRNRPLREVRESFVGGGWTAARDPYFRSARANPVAVLRATFADVSSIAALELDGAVPEVAPAAESTYPDDAVTSFVAGRADVAAYERRRWSYSALAGELEARDEGTGELEASGGIDEAGEVTADEVEQVRRDVAEVFGDLAGTGLGVMIHGALEDMVGAAPAAGVTPPWGGEARRLGANAG